MDQTQQPAVPVNPLSMFMRQPKIYIRLPSGGNWWPKGSLEITANGEYPVYSMTARDELLLQVPDALMNGQAIVDVIQHCIPNIKDAWHTPNIDVDVLLIAIRIATYGEKLSTPIKVVGDIELEYQVDLRTVLDELMSKVSWDPVVPVNDDLTIFVKPLTYRDLTKASITTFETQKIIQIANNENMAEDDKVKLFKESLDKLTEVTIGTVKNSIFKVDSSQGSTDNPTFINEFVNNIDKSIFTTVQTHLENMREKNGLKPIIVPVTDEMREQGVTTDTIEVPLAFDPTTFFG
jgi:hypothetical protein